MNVKVLILFVMMFFATLVANSTVCSSISSGDWTSASSWSCGRQPINGDSVIVNLIHTISVTTNINTPTNTFYIFVDGIFNFNVGKLSMSSSSYVVISSSGLIRNSGGGGSSSIINIGGNDEWKASDGDLGGPTTLGNVPLTLFYNKNQYNNNYVDDFLLITSLEGWIKIKTSSITLVEISSITGTIFFVGYIDGDAEILMKNKNSMLICKTYKNNQVKYFKIFMF